MLSLLKLQIASFLLEVGSANFLDLHIESVILIFSGSKPLTWHRKSVYYLTVKMLSLFFQRFYVMLCNKSNCNTTLSLHLLLSVFHRMRNHYLLSSSIMIALLENISLYKTLETLCNIRCNLS